MSKFSHMSHGQGDHATGHAGKNLATDGAAKRVTKIAVHSGMTSLQKGGAGVGGQGHAVAAITDGGQTVAASSAAAPLASAYGGAPSLKAGRAVAPAFGQRSRGPTPDSMLGELGRAVLDQSFSASDAATRQAHGRK